MKIISARRVLKWLLGSVAGMGLLVSAVIVYLVWPRAYDKTYVQSSLSRHSEGLAYIANVGRERTFYVGTIGVPERLNELDGLLPREFNSVTPENAMKWPALLRGGRLGRSGEPIYDFSAADRLVDFCLAKGVRVRGHNLVWGRYLSEEFVADIQARLATSANRQEAMREILRNHIRTVMTHFRGRIQEWDVLNEPLQIFGPKLDDTLWRRTLGDGYIGEVFKIAHEIDPQAILYLNEQFDDYSDAHAEKLLSLLEELVREKVPIHGLGLESHLVMRKPTPEALENYLRRVVALGLTFELTELDVRLRVFGQTTAPYEAQGDYFEAIIRAAMSFPQCRGITFWGISDKDTWMDSMFPIRFMKPNEPDLFDLNGVRKPAYWAAERAFHERPPSIHSAKAETDPQGRPI